VAVKPDFAFVMPGISMNTMTDRNGTAREDDRTDRLNLKPYKKDEEGKYVKKGTASCWMSREFPISLADFLPILETLGGGSA
jgi:hypothetical protein